MKEQYTKQQLLEIVKNPKQFMKLINEINIRLDRVQEKIQMDDASKFLRARGRDVTFNIDGSIETIKLKYEPETTERRRNGNSLIY